ncbi:MAG: hypothetical protein O9254_00890 [Rhodobacteraceae bacterium]|nr:hypothetical protein [Paracoccaceae bacterium]
MDSVRFSKLTYTDLLKMSDRELAEIERFARDTIAYNNGVEAEPEPFSPGYNRAVAAVIVEPFIFHMYMHLHLIWWPYYRDVA